MTGTDADGEGDGRASLGDRFRSPFIRSDLDLVRRRRRRAAIDTYARWRNRR